MPLRPTMRLSESPPVNAAAMVIFSDRRSRFARAVAVREIGAGKVGHQSMSARIIDADAEVARPLVEIQRADLKDGTLSPAIEVPEVHEVDQQFIQVAMIADEAVDFGDCVGLGFQRFVFCDQGGDLLFGVGGEDGADALRGRAIRPWLRPWWRARRRTGRTWRRAWPSRFH